MPANFGHVGDGIRRTLLAVPGFAFVARLGG
jgi:hypothetical protein